MQLGQAVHGGFPSCGLPVEGSFGSIAVRCCHPSEAADRPPDISARRRSQPKPVSNIQVRQDQQVRAASNPVAFDVGKSRTVTDLAMSITTHILNCRSLRLSAKASRINRDVSMLIFKWAADSTSMFWHCIVL